MAVSFGSGRLGGGTGPKGPKGDPGNSINFKPAVGTLAALSVLTGMMEDDARVVNENGHVYVYNGLEWIDGGQFLGPKGETGDPSTVPGPTGPSGPSGPSGSTGSTGPTGQTGTGYTLTTTSISPTFSIGNKTFPVVQNPTTTAYVIGSRVRLAYNATNWLEGEITALKTSTPYSITVAVDKYQGNNGGGSGDWNGGD